MTLILALETSTEWCSVALAQRQEDGVRLITRTEQTGPRSSDRILPMVDAVLAEAGVRLAACDAIAFGAGPGSFTGLRTACGVAQGLAVGIDRPIIAVNSLEACAEQIGADLPDGMPVVVALDARMNECYWATFQREGTDWAALTPTRVSPPEAVEAPDRAFWLVGNALTVFGEQLVLATQAQRCLPAVLPDASGVATIALRMFAAGRAQPAELAAPLYVRDKVALTVAERQAVAQAKAARVSADH